MGSVFVGYNGSAPAVPEYNVYDNVDAALAVYAQNWTIVSAPLDVTVFVRSLLVVARAWRSCLFVLCLEGDGESSLPCLHPYVCMWMAVLQAQIQGLYYQQLLRSTNPITRVLLDNYAYWVVRCPWVNESLIPPDVRTVSSTVHDLVAAMLVVDDSALSLQSLDMSINSVGMTLDGNQGRLVAEALKWVDFEVFSATVALALM